MLFLEHAQSDEWDSLLVKNYQLPNVICVAEVELYQRGEPIYTKESLARPTSNRTKVPTIVIT